MSENQHAPKWLLHIMQSIYDMRLAQKEYFQHPCDPLLRVAKHKESIVDNIVKDGISKGYIKEKENHKPAQQKLFK